MIYWPFLVLNVGSGRGFDDLRGTGCRRSVPNVRSQSSTSRVPARSDAAHLQAQRGRHSGLQGSHHGTTTLPTFIHQLLILLLKLIHIHLTSSINQQLTLFSYYQLLILLLLWLKLINIKKLTFIQLIFHRFDYFYYFTSIINQQLTLFSYY